MPSALETLVKILRLEQNTQYKNTAVIGGLESFAENWSRDAHHQAKRPEHHQLVDEMVGLMRRYPDLEALDERHETIKYMIGRVMGRIPPAEELPPPAAGQDQEALQLAEEAQSEGIHETDPSSDGTAPVEDTTPDAGAAPDQVPDEHAAHENTPVDAAEEDSAPAAEPATRPRRAFHRRTNQDALPPEEVRARLEALQQPVTVLHKVGAKMSEKLTNLGIHTVGDMLYTFPRRYDDYTRMKTLNHLTPGEVVTTLVAVRSIVRKQGRRGQPYLLMTVDDGTRTMNVTFFGQPWLQRQFKRGSQIVLSGTVELFRGDLMMTNPEWEMFERENLHTNRIVPVYPLTKGLSARTMRRLMRQAIDEYAQDIPDHVPDSVLERTDLPDLSWAIQQIHFPDSFADLEEARTRIGFDELFTFHMAMLGNRREWQNLPGEPIHAPDEWLEHFTSSLPYPLTDAQQRAINDIRGDMAQATPMNRLLQGDVGSGKTVVAAAAMAIAVQAGKQAALMAPTSLLAEQHARSLSQILNSPEHGIQTEVRLLTSSTPESERQVIYDGLASGDIQVLVGTHALIQDNISFHDLGLAIVDEQHRFGVEQRGALRDKGKHPHMLVMTATPIPRTLALTLYADLDLTIIDEMPPGRTPVQTIVINPLERQRAYGFIQSQIDQGRQAFIVYPLVESSDKLDELGSAIEGFEQLNNEMFARYRVGLLHGQMSAQEKEDSMRSFANGEIDLLVSTSVVEVGIDIPNASVILIENAERFGLAQLHQFRGRVGRGQHQSYCLLVAGSNKPEAEQRLKAMEQTSDGFELAEIDWKMRGSGDLVGVRQSGTNQFRLAELMNPRLVELAQREARTISAEDPALEANEHQLLRSMIRQQTQLVSDIS